MSVFYIDQYLNKSPNIPRSNFQIVGLAALYIAAKVEEVKPPSTAAFAMDNEEFSAVNIKNTEMRLMRVISWKILPCTSCNWLSFLMTSWDAFLKGYLVNMETSDL